MTIAPLTFKVKCSVCAHQRVGVDTGWHCAKDVRPHKGRQSARNFSALAYCIDARSLDGACGPGAKLFTRAAV